MIDMIFPSNIPSANVCYKAVQANRGRQINISAFQTQTDWKCIFFSLKGELFQTFFYFSTTELSFIFY